MFDILDHIISNPSEFIDLSLIDDLVKRICTVAEINFYFTSLYGNGKTGSFLKPNKNCNLTSWVSGCEPGWACSVGEDQDVDLKNSKITPSRILSCQSCCAGFFCPQGITCMIRKNFIHFFLFGFIILEVSSNTI